MAGTIPSDMMNGGMTQEISRPLSELSSNADKRRSLVKESNRPDKTSRPSSEVKEPDAKRQSLSVPLQTITVNLADYGSTSPKLPSAPSTASLTTGPPPPSPSTKPSVVALKLDKASLGRPLSIPGSQEGETAVVKTSSDTQDGISPLLAAKRASLRPLPVSYADVLKPPTPSTISPSGSDYFDTSSPAAASSKPPPPKSKPSWLRRASMNPSRRSKSRSPASSTEDLPESSSPNYSSTFPVSTSVPPLPPRKANKVNAAESAALHETPQNQKSMPPPPSIPHRTTYASVALGNRSRLSENQGRPAYSPGLEAPSLGPRDANSFKGRLAAWTSAAQASGSSISRSESTNTLSTSPSGSFGGFAGQQRLPASAQRVLGNAGSAVQKGWAGFRAKGVGGSISSMSNLAAASRRSVDKAGRPADINNSWGSTLSRGGSSKTDGRSSVDNAEGGSDGPIFEEGVCKRRSQGRTGRLFGRDLVEAGQTWPVYDASELGEDVDEWQKRRKRCLPALVVRAVDYLELWGPKEEGIFRISGRMSHITRLRKEFDAGADLDLTLCHPGDLDPHAVSSIFKSYLRELPAPLLTTSLVPKFAAFARKRQDQNLQQSSSIASGDGQSEDLTALLHQLPNANWFLLADIVKLLDIISQHSAINRMSLSNLMLVLQPTLNISTLVLNQLLEQRKILFATPPPLTGIDTAATLIDFGDINLLSEPPVINIVPLRPVSPEVTEVASTDALTSTTPKKLPPKLPKKPSLSRLISTSSTFVSAAIASASSNGSGSPKRTPKKQPSAESMSSSMVNIDPPRIELEVGPTSPLPTFTDPNDTPSLPHRSDSGTVLNADLVSAKDQNDDFRYPQGTVEERMKLFSALSAGPSTSTSTPIADKFQGTGSPLLALRGNSPAPPLSDSGGPRSEFGSAPTNPVNPATVVGRGHNTFFQSAAGTERRSRSSTVVSLGNNRAARNDGHSREPSSDQERREFVVDLADDPELREGEGRGHADDKA